MCHSQLESLSIRRHKGQWKRVQRSATRACSPLRHIPYNDWLVALNLPSLMYRRRRMDMIMMYKILHGLDGIPFDVLFSYHHTATRSNGYKFYKNFLPPGL